jgi:hypothetical protein
MNIEIVECSNCLVLCENTNICINCHSYFCPDCMVIMKSFSDDIASDEDDEDEIISVSDMCINCVC